MIGRSAASPELARHVETARREVKPWVEPAARIGHGAKGLVFVLTGLLVAAARLGIGGDVDGPAAAFAAVGRAPLGAVMLAMIGIGLLYYALWELCRAIADPERDARGKVLLRLEWLITAVLFGFLSTAALRAAFHRAAARGDDVARTWASRALVDIPHGAVVLALVGALVVVAGVILIRRGWRADFGRAIDLTGFGPASSAVIDAIARFGLAARGVVTCTIGVFVLIAAWTHDPGEVIGLEGALRALGHPSAPWLMAVVAIGLASYGLYELLIAWRGRFYID